MDHYIDRVAFNLSAPAVQSLFKLATREYRAPTFKQGMHQREFTRRQRRLDTIEEKGAPFKI
jgi:hypothetical protein